jgi:hypothetical protein
MMWIIVSILLAHLVKFALWATAAWGKSPTPPSVHRPPFPLPNLRLFPLPPQLHRALYLTVISQFSSGSVAVGTLNNGWTWQARQKGGKCGIRIVRCLTATRLQPFPLTDKKCVRLWVCRPCQFLMNEKRENFNKSLKFKASMISVFIQTFLCCYCVCYLYSLPFFMSWYMLCYLYVCYNFQNNFFVYFKYVPFIFGIYFWYSSPSFFLKSWHTPPHKPWDASPKNLPVIS